MLFLLLYQILQWDYSPKEKVKSENDSIHRLVKGFVVNECDLLSPKLW